MTTHQTSAAGLQRQYVKLCDLPDFDDPELRRYIDEIAPGHRPEEQVRRKFWEYAMLAAYLEDVGAVTNDAEVLAVAAGHEEPLFWMANRVRRVVATDIYGDGEFAYREAAATMVTDPASFSPVPYREDHLEVLHMDALELTFDDASFDIVFSLSSIEHFGEPSAIRKAASEMARVVRPGGHLVIVTECFVGSSLLDSPKVQYAIKLATFGRKASTATPRKRSIEAFSESEIARDICVPVGLDLVQPLETRISPQTWENLTRLSGDGQLHPKSGEPYPHILLHAHGSPWTSAFLAFRKPVDA